MTEVKDEFETGRPVVEETEGDATEENATVELVDNHEEIEAVDNGNDSIIEELTVKLREEENKRLRLLADYDNFKRRTALDKEAAQKYRAQNVVTNLIPVLDNFARALSVEVKTEEAQSLMTGVEMVYRTLVEALEAEGLVEIEALDKEFDPNFHQAIMTGSDEEKASGIVLEDMQKGYMLKDRVLRPSMVKVNE
ncbi:nucleotide exchange factor GrpE [Sporosarcina sp. FSL K6-1522]|uniref:nucleotide exchange factor GrpE n=1 Tax=Sporosarcina sp. FSL K6-1522 TaxID=2921554 RepID=UPI00315B2A52